MEAVKLTGLWKNKTQKGEIFLSGKLNAVASVMVMPNSYKRSDSDPDYFLYVKPAQDKQEKKEPVAAAQEDL